MSRNFNDPQYKKWRKDVYKRDGFKCRFPNCNVRKGLNAHHIKTWSENPILRFVLGNGITLCKKHHKQVTGHESEYEQCFANIVNPISVQIKGFLYRMRVKNEE